MPTSSTASAGFSRDNIWFFVLDVCVCVCVNVFVCVQGRTQGGGSGGSGPPPLEPVYEYN